MQPSEKAAHDILAMIEATYQPTHRYVSVDARSYSHLDQRFYDRTSRFLDGCELRRLADIEDRTITETPGTALMPVLVR